MEAKDAEMGRQRGELQSLIDGQRRELQTLRV